MLRRSWLEVDLSQLAQNWRLLASRLPQGMEPMAVVKADAYGHGDLPVSHCVQSLGCRNFAVSNIEEAVRLREDGIKGQILILGYTPPECWETLKQYEITQALLCEEHAAALAGHGLLAQFAIDTGMNRIGLDGDDSSACEAAIRRFAPQFQLTGLFTHLCVADTPSEDEFTEGQMARFAAVADRVRDLKLPCIHCMNSAGSLWKRPYGRLGRLGIVLYGMKPDAANTLPEGLKPCLRWMSVISMVKTVHEGETIGYGRTYTAQGERRIATIPTGYADGYSRLYARDGYVIIHGRRAPITGRVCMDQMMVDVSDIPEAAAGDEVELMGESCPPDELARRMGSINYEVCCMIGKRVPRVYLNMPENSDLQQAEL